MYNFYNVTTDKTDEWQALEKIKVAEYARGYAYGRQAGFAAGYEAAQGKPQAKIEEAYQQGVRYGYAQAMNTNKKNDCGY